MVKVRAVFQCYCYCLFPDRLITDEHTVSKNRDCNNTLRFEQNIMGNLNPAGIYLFKVYNGNTRAICDICLKLSIKTPEHVHEVPLTLIVNFVIYFTHCSGVFIVEFEQGNVSWYCSIYSQCSNHVQIQSLRRIQDPIKDLRQSFIPKKVHG